MARSGQGRAEQTRAALVAAAAEALREVGFAGASAREIAARAGCNQALVFYHFGSVTELLLAALDDVSARRHAAYAELIECAGTPGELVDAAREVFVTDLESGHVAVLAELIAGARATPGLGAEIAARLAPWRELAESAVRTALAASPLGPLAALLSAREPALALVAGLLGLELLATLDGDHAAALALFDRARALVGLLEVAG